MNDLVVLWQGEIEGRELRVIDIPSDGEGPSVQELRRFGLYPGVWVRCHGRDAERAMRTYNDTKGT